MSAPLAEEKSLFTSIRMTLAISGVIALLAAIALLVWPEKSAVIVTAIFASYLIAAGLVYIGLGIFTSAKGVWARIGHIVLGLLYIVAGMIAFANLQEATVALALVVVIFIGISWIFDGFVALSLLGHDGSRVWTLLYALLSIIAGVIVLFSPLVAGFTLWLLLAASLIALGLVQIVRAITIGKDAKDLAAAVKEEVTGIE